MAKAGGHRAARVLIGGADTGGRFAVIETSERQGTVPLCRVHTWEDQAVYVLEGVVSFCVDGAWSRCPGGTCVLLPRGCEHTYSVESQEARLLTLAVPSGFEGFYREMDERDGSSQAVTRDFEWLVTVAARYGVEIALPESGTGGRRREEGMEQE